MAKLIRVSDSTYKELAKDGKWSDTMDSLIVRLLNKAHTKETDTNQ
jgi:hypothetical protein